MIWSKIELYPESTSVQIADEYQECGIIPRNVSLYHISRGTEIFPFSYFENPWLECELVIKDINNIHNFYKTRTYGLNFGEKVFKTVIT